MGEEIVWLQFYRFLQPGQAFVGSTGKHQKPSFQGVDLQAKWVEFSSASNFGQSFVKPAHNGQQARICKIGIGAVWVKFECPFVLILGSAEIPVVKLYRKAKRCMGFSKRIVDAEGLLRGCLRLWIKLGRGHVYRKRKRAVRVSQTGICQGIRAVGIDRLLKE